MVEVEVRGRELVIISRDDPMGGSVSLSRKVAGQCRSRRVSAGWRKSAPSLVSPARQGYRQSGSERRSGEDTSVPALEKVVATRHNVAGSIEAKDEIGPAESWVKNCTIALGRFECVCAGRSPAWQNVSYRSQRGRQASANVSDWRKRAMQKSRRKGLGCGYRTRLLARLPFE